jgi:signal peptidase
VIRAAKILVGFFAAFSLLLSAGPAFLPFQVFPVLDGKMAPAINPGSVVVVTRVPASQLRVGDVVTFQPPGQTGFVTRRVFTLQSSGAGPVAQTRADAEARPDSGRLSFKGTGWRAAFSVPLLGYLVAPPGSAGRLLLLLVPGLLLFVLLLVEHRRQQTPAGRQAKAGAGRQVWLRTTPRSLIVVGVLLLLATPATFAVLFAQTTNANGSFTNVALVSPTAPAGSYTPSTVVLTWTAASPMNGNGYAISAVNNGASNVCPAAVASYTTYVGSTAAVTLTDLGAIARGAPGTYACYLIQTGYNPAGVPPWAAAPQWTSLTALARIAVRLGVQNVRIGAESAIQITTLTVPFTASAAGNLLVANLSVGPSATTSTASAGWVYANGINTAGEGRNEIWYYPNNPGGLTTVTFTLAAGNGGLGQVTEWKNVSKVAPLDKTGTVSVAVNNVNATVSTSAAVTLANELAIVNAGFNTQAGQVITPAAGWTPIANDVPNGYAAQYRFDRPAGFISETINSAPATAWSVVIAAFK